jgi:phage repressor protein C with HTH and peptisase S24 domain
MPYMTSGSVPERRRGFGLVTVRGRSMQPTLSDGDRLLVRWGCGLVRPGAVAVVRLPGDRPLAIKRIVFREAGQGWWVERDNPAVGVDSWQVGAIDEADVLGVALLRLFPSPGIIAKRSQ